MISRVLIIGGYGNFGTFVSQALERENNIKLIIAGRSLDKANKLVRVLKAVHPAESVFLDIHKNLVDILKTLKPDIVIHTSGPFQTQNYDVAKACIAQGCHYIDLADGREFVNGIETLHQAATERAVLIVSGASSVPCLTSALVDGCQAEFETLELLEYGISTAQRTARGVATTAAILGYAGKPFKTLIDGKQVDVYGWQGLGARKYKNLGWRLLGYCDIPDLVLFPKRYPNLKTIRFYAGLEIPFIHLALWVLSGLVRIGLIKNLQKTAVLLLRLAFMFDGLGTANSAFHMRLSGKAKNGDKKSITFELTARSGDGPYIPCMPAILLAKKLARNEISQTGAYPCVGFINREQYLGALSELDIAWEESVS